MFSQQFIVLKNQIFLLFITKYSKNNTINTGICYYLSVFSKWNILAYCILVYLALARRESINDLEFLASDSLNSLNF